MNLMETRTCKKKLFTPSSQGNNQPQLYFPTNLFTEATYSPALCFNVTTREVNPEYIQTYNLSVEEENFADHHPSRITIHGFPNRLSVNLIARYIRTRLELLGLHYNITSDSMTYFDINAAITDPVRDPRQPYMVNHKTPAQIIVQGTKHVLWILHNDICFFLTRQLLGKTTMFPEVDHFLIKSIRPIVSDHLSNL